MLTHEIIEKVLTRLPSLTIGVVGDLFLDRYLDIDARLTEPSLETGLDAFQVVRVRSQPGAAGTVINNLAALGVGKIVPIAIIGDDGEGYELRQALRHMPAVDASCIMLRADRRTPTYTKPMLYETNRPARELNRLDIKNRTVTPPNAVEAIIAAIERHWRTLDAIIVLDQVSEEDCGVVTKSVREAMARFAFVDPTKFILADSRERIGLFHEMCLKPNRRECLRAANTTDLAEACRILAKRSSRTLFCTAAESGIIVADPDGGAITTIAGFPVQGPVDPVGAGDSVSAAIASGVSAGLDLVDAAAFGNLVASITVQQIGTTGTATPAQVRARWKEIEAGGVAT